MESKKQSKTKAPSPFVYSMFWLKRVICLRLAQLLVDNLGLFTVFCFADPLLHSISYCLTWL